MLSLVLALVLVTVATALILLVAALVFNALDLPMGLSLERRRFARARGRRDQGDALLERGDIERALQAFGAAFYLESVVSDRSLLAEVTNHHTALLSRFIAVCNEVQGGTVRLMSLAKADRLLTERGELQRRCLMLRGRRASAAQLREVYSRLRENRVDLEACIRQLAAEILAARPVARYH